MSDRDPERQRELTDVALKVAGVVLGIGIIVGIGSWVMVSALGLNAGSSDGEQSAAQVEPVQPLPTTALPVPTLPSDPNAQTTVPPPSSTAPSGALQLSATPQQVAPMERINLTGTWAGKDNITLQVQRLEGGAWDDFAGVTASVRVGTFETWVATGREGVQQFRVYDPQSDTASNVVKVTVG